MRDILINIQDEIQRCCAEARECHREADIEASYEEYESEDARELRHEAEKWKAKAAGLEFAAKLLQEEQANLDMANAGLAHSFEGWIRWDAVEERLDELKSQVARIKRECVDSLKQAGEVK